MMRQCFLLLCLCLPLWMSAQEDMRERMNAIKRDADYLWEEVRAEKADEARDDARQGLLIQINAGRSVPLTYADLSDRIQDMQMPRGSKTLWFACIRKSTIGGTTAAPATAPAPAQTPAPAPVSAPASSPASAPAQAQTQAQTQAPATSTVGGTSARVVMSLIGREMITEVYKCLQEYKQEGSIQDMGPSYPSKVADDVYVVLYGKDRTVQAIFTPKADGTRRNILTDNNDDISNYSNCGAVWFK